MDWDKLQLEVTLDPTGTAKLSDEGYGQLMEFVLAQLRAKRAWVTHESQLADQLDRTSPLSRSECERIARAIAVLELGAE